MMIIGKWSRRLAILAMASVAIWTISGKLLMEFEWTPMTSDAERIAKLRRDAASGLAYDPIDGPCMMHATTVDLDLWLDGPFPVGAGREIVMQVGITSNILLSPRIYIGPPTRRLDLRGLPACTALPQIPAGQDEEEAFAYIDIQFFDLAGEQYLNFGGEQPFPIFRWRQMRVDWSVVPWWIEKTESPTSVMVVPL